MRAIIFLLLGAAVAGLAGAQEFPQVLDSERILSAEEVKNYWVNKMPEPREPSRLARDYKTEHLQYFEKVGRRHRLITEIRGGQHDGLAVIVALRHNIQARLLLGEPDKADALRAELAELEDAARRDELLQLQRANAERLDRLIAATERLAAAIENNPGILPPEAPAEADVAADDEIIPFERNRDRDRADPHALVIDLREEILAFRSHPIIVHRGNPNRIRPSHVHPRTGTTAHIHTHGGHPSVQQPTVRQPAVRQPAVRPAQVPRPQRKITPSVQPRRQPQQQVRPSPAVQPRQPQVRQPQIRPAR